MRSMLLWGWMALAVVGCSSGGGGGGHYSENSCEYAFDGECDEPDYCAPGTDSYDCGSNAQPAPKATITCNGKQCTGSWKVGGLIDMPGCCAIDGACGASTDAVVEAAFGLQPGCYALHAPGSTNCGCPAYEYSNPMTHAPAQFPGCCPDAGGCGYAVSLESASGPNLGCVPAGLLD